MNQARSSRGMNVERMACPNTVSIKLLIINKVYSCSCGLVNITFNANYNMYLILYSIL